MKQMSDFSSNCAFFIIKLTSSAKKKNGFHVQKKKQEKQEGRPVNTTVLMDACHPVLHKTYQQGVVKRGEEQRSAKEVIENGPGERLVKKKTCNKEKQVFSGMGHSWPTVSRGMSFRPSELALMLWTTMKSLIVW